MILLSDSSSGNSSEDPAKLSLHNLFQAYPVFEQLCRYLDIGDVIALTRTCMALSHIYHALVSQQHWNVDRDLMRFVKDPRRFRNQLGESDALISGSFALQFFERQCWEESDLDIFVEEGEGARELERYLNNVEEYQLISEDVPEDYLTNHQSIVKILLSRTCWKNMPDGL